jgi:hypothetical protein
LIPENLQMQKIKPTTGKEYFTSRDQAGVED